MNVFKIDYFIQKTNKQFNVTIIANTKEKAIDFLIRRFGNVKINTISSVSDTIHVIDDEILNEIVTKSPKTKKYQEKITILEKIIKEFELEKKSMETIIDNYQKQPSSKDIKDALSQQKTQKIYCCPFCDYESTSQKGIKMHITKQHPKE